MTASERFSRRVTDLVASPIRDTPPVPVSADIEPLASMTKATRSLVSGMP